MKESLRMRPSRVIVGEVRAEECLDLLLALNAGLPGMCTIHANSAREALVKCCTLPLLAGENISARFVVPTVAASRRPRGPPRHRRARRTPRQRGRRGPGPGRERRHRDRADLRARTAPSCVAPAGCRRGSSSSSGAASTCTGSSPGRWTADGCARRARRRRRAAADLVGVLRRRPSPRTARKRGRTAELLARAGLGEVSITGFLVLCVVGRHRDRRSWSRWCRGLRRWRSPSA